MKAVLVGSGILVALLSTAQAQVNPKREACLQEAQAKGLYTTSGKHAGMFNRYNGDARHAFMKECMGRH